MTSFCQQIGVYVYVFGGGGERRVVYDSPESN